MSSKKDLKKFEETIGAIKSLTKVFEQSAVGKMKVSQTEIEKITKYLTAARGTYSDTKISLISKMDQKHKEIALRSSFRKTTKPQILVLIASQDRYYGNLMPSLFALFMEEYRKSKSDAIILGKIGKELLDNENINAQNITYYDFEDTKPDWDLAHKIIESLAIYEQIILFYGQYESVLTQHPRKEVVTQNVSVQADVKPKKYLFRPEPGNSLSFLESQIIAGAFVSKLYESGVAKFAARVKLLEIGQVAERISAATDVLQKGKLKARKESNNRKQMQLFTGANLWQGGK